MTYIKHAYNSGMKLEIYWLHPRLKILPIFFTNFRTVLQKILLFSRILDKYKIICSQETSKLDSCCSCSYQNYGWNIDDSSIICSYTRLSHKNKDKETKLILCQIVMKKSTLPNPCNIEIIDDWLILTINL